MPRELVFAFSGTVKELREELKSYDIPPDEEKVDEEIDEDRVDRALLLELQKTNSLDCHSVFNF